MFNKISVFFPFFVYFGFIQLQENVTHFDPFNITAR